MGVMTNLTDGCSFRTAPVQLEEQIFHGLGVSPGVAIGVAHLHDTGNVNVPVYSIAPEALEAAGKLDALLA